MNMSQATLVPKRRSRRYLLRDQFTTADAAPIASPRTCEPGPGTLTAVQNDGTLAISGGKLAFTAQSTPVYGDQGFYGGGVTRVAGRCLLSSAVLNEAARYGHRISFGSAAVSDQSDAGFAFYQGTIIALNGAVAPEVGTYSASTEYEFCIVLRAGGSFILVKGGAFTNWTLLFVFATPNTATEYPKFLNYNGNGTLDNFRVPTQLWTPTPLVSDNFMRADSVIVGSSAGGGGEESGGTGIASTEVAGDWDISSNTLVTAGAVPANTGFIATWATGVASVVVQCQVTLQANSVAGIILSSDGTDWVRVAVDDANNVIRIHDYNGVDTYTQRGSTSVTIAASTAYQLIAIRDGANVTGYVNGGSRVAYASESVNATATAHGLASSTAADAFDNLVIWNRTQSVPSF